MNWKKALWIWASTAVLAATVWAWLMPVPATPVESTRPIWADNFVSDYEARHGVTTSEVMTQLLYSSNSACGDLVAGNSLPQVWQMLTDHGQSSDQAATVIELSIKYYCPQFTNLLKE